MNPETFFENFDFLCEAPNGVEEMRELILQLAVQGKLVPQDPNDEPASVLLEKIKAEKKKLVKEKIIRANSFDQIKKDELLFKIPNNWEWVRLGEIGDWGAGSTPNRRNSEYFGGTIKWFKSGELNDGYIVDSEEKITDLALKDCSLRLNKKGDVLIAMYGATIGKIAILDTESTTNQAVCACTCFTGVYNRYLFFLLKAYRQYFASQGAGGAQPNISRIKIVNTIAPLPPLAEQKRIVTKVDELMALCDQLEARQQKKKELRSKLNSAALDKMLSAEGRDEFKENWRRICENFDLLYDNPENVEELRKAVLQLAVQGKLVEQNPDDEQASVLVEKIRVEKEKLINEKKIKKEKELEPVDSDDLPFESPTGWAWEKIYNICFVTKLAGFEYTKYIQLNDFGDVPIIRAQNVKMNRIVEKNLKFIDLQTSQMLKRSALTKPSILMTFIGAGIGDVALFDDCKRWHLGPNVAKLEPFNNLGEKIDIKYLLLYLMSETGRNEIFKYKKSTAQPSLSMGTIRDIKVILPPLNEQKRIVEKVEQLMGLCDELEAKLRKGREESERMMEAVVRGLIEGAAAEI